MVRWNIIFCGKKQLDLKNRGWSRGRDYLQMDSTSEFLGVIELDLDCGGG